MKHVTCLLLVSVLSLMVSTIWAQKAKPHDPNPTKDPDVQRGYDQHQKEYRGKKESVDKSSDTAKGNPPSDEGGKPGGGSEGVRIQTPRYVPPQRPVGR